ncbi:MAG: Lrp/AsnC ligand binding domain-containing protein [Candidatus Lokiarchaeota archaeon]|nr:Lrp/AsnC ligand binding domain-containing protein [Candidatus Lokiarchaeota archaeon]
MATSENIETQLFIKNLTGKTKFVISKNSRALGISRQTYQNKLDNLRKEKIINSFTININPIIHPVGLKYVMIEIKTNPKEPELVDELLKIPQLRILDGILGDFSLFGLFIFKSSQEYHQILNIIDKIMAGSYFKKYQIIETIKIFKTHGISLRESKFSFELGFKINLKRLAEKTNSQYNPQRFPYVLMKLEDLQANIIIYPSGKVDAGNFNDNLIIEDIIVRILDELKSAGIDVTKRKVDQSLKVDELDFIILKILQDAQGSRPISTYEIRDIFNKNYSKILQKLNKDDISQSTIHNRIKILENQGVILNYTINFSPKKVGFSGKYYLRIKPKDPSKYDELAFKLVKNKNITDLFRIGEQHGLFAIVRVKKVEDYADFIRNLYQSDEIEDTLTNFVLDELKPYTNFVIY